MAETDVVWRSLRTVGSTRYSVLVLNRRGLEQALSIGIPHVEIYVSASETHSKRNSGVTVAKAIADAVGMIEFALAAGATVTAGVMCAFGCFFEGEVPVSRVGEIVKELNQPLPTEIGLADTTGMARPETIKALSDRLSPVINGPDRLTIHLHDTRGLGLANLEAALEFGIRRFDTSVGGLGGCPFIPGAAGNIATEATVEFLHARGFSTGIDPEAVKAAKRRLELLLGRRFEPASTVNVP
jgi:hydroxymethylglutaryl-CoA lyase